jgi:hypothetical protein
MQNANIVRYDIFFLYRRPKKVFIKYIMNIEIAITKSNYVHAKTQI